MIYYSTGKSPYLPSRGKTVESNNSATVDILLKKGSIVLNKEDLDVVNLNPIIESKPEKTKEAEKPNENVVKKIDKPKNVNKRGRKPNSNKK